ncbi:hypothetical protein [Bradyrhizobium sp. 18]|uniref:hypothetical protein n=1 Tax=Bradyrhizobium sp. 18 TaxID=2782657 RepID=UPI001FFA3E0D|nr:hypothetical protein [Bradyrhizobium sp. 18]MCK1506835.1 hypothetical protein [Bradyrhizobium sp. 18]
MSFHDAAGEIIGLARVEGERIGVTQTPVFLGAVEGGLTFPVFQARREFRSRVSGRTDACRIGLRRPGGERLPRQRNRALDSPVSWRPECPAEEGNQRARCSGRKIAAGRRSDQRDVIAGLSGKCLTFGNRTSLVDQQDERSRFSPTQARNPAKFADILDRSIAESPAFANYVMSYEDRRRCAFLLES